MKDYIQQVLDEGPTGLDGHYDPDHFFEQVFDLFKQHYESGNKDCSDLGFKIQGLMTGIFAKPIEYLKLCDAEDEEEREAERRYEQSIKYRGPVYPPETKV